MKHLETPSITLAKEIITRRDENHFSPLNCIFLHFSRKSAWRKRVNDKFFNEIKDLEAVSDVVLQKNSFRMKDLARVVNVLRELSRQGVKMRRDIALLSATLVRPPDPRCTHIPKKLRA
jgi:hypothetical protein